MEISTQVVFQILNYRFLFFLKYSKGSYPENKNITFLTSNVVIVTKYNWLNTIKCKPLRSPP